MPDLRDAIAAAASRVQRRSAPNSRNCWTWTKTRRRAVQAGFVNFYADDAANPYVALAARGPWIVTLKGAVIYDTGGYGMLGFGHTPAAVIEAMAKPQAMANIMTPSGVAAALRPRDARRSARPVAPARTRIPVPELGFRIGVAGLRASSTSMPS
jgi:hypothetical protein